MHPCAQGTVSDSAVDANLVQPNPHASSNVKDSPFKEGVREEEARAAPLGAPWSADCAAPPGAPQQVTLLPLASSAPSAAHRKTRGEEKGDASLPVSHCCRSIASSACGVPVCPPLSPPRPVALVLH